MLNLHDLLKTAKEISAKAGNQTQIFLWPTPQSPFITLLQLLWSTSQCVKSSPHLNPCRIYNHVGFTSSKPLQTFIFLLCKFRDLSVAMGLTNPGEIWGPKPRLWLMFSLSWNPPILEPFWGGLPADEFWNPSPLEFLLVCTMTVT